MKFLFYIIIFFFLFGDANAQDVPNPMVEQQLENIAEAENGETEDDAFQQQFQQMRKNPMNLNTATETEMQIFFMLTSLQIRNFIDYRQLLGKLISIYELQAVPGWNIETINLIRPFVTVSGSTSVVEDFGKRFSGGQHSILARVSQTIEKSRGFTPDTAGNTKYLGSPQRVLVRYKYLYKNLLQFGVLGEKDAGEQFFKGAQKNGFDFYSIHLFARNLGIIKRLAIGDYTVNLAQGLLTFQSLAFRKSADVMNIKRQTEIFRPYNSPGEYNYHRGAAITVGLGNNVQLSAFVSKKKVDANAVSDSANYEDYVSSILNSGYHRTEAENEDRQSIDQFTVGGRLQVRHKRLQLAVNAVHYKLGSPLQKTPEPYNYYAFSGDKLTGVSIDYGYTFRNVHLFGEVASDDNRSLAMVHGLVASLDSRVDFSLLYRNIAKDYHSLYANAFTESTTPINEKGLYAGLSIKPWGSLRLDMYADAYSFPWLKYLVDRPSKGFEYLIQLNWKPNKVVEVYTRFKSESKATNYSNTDLPYHQTENVPRQNWRTQVSYKVSSAVTLRARAEALWYDHKGPTSETGFLIFTDVFYKPMMKPLQLNMRLQYFETDDYNSRIYAYESDVLYSYSIPPFYGKGYRTYLNVNYDFTRHLTAWFRLARTLYPGATSVGSGYDEIPGDHKTDYRVQVIYNF